MGYESNRNATLRCFVTKCRLCETIVLYWESIRGSKVFFEYPVGEKLRRHFCKPKGNLQPSKSQAELRFDIHHREKYPCPVCGKLFNQEIEVMQHMRDKQKSESIYQDFFENIYDFTDKAGENQNKKTERKTDFDQTAHFGKIVIKNRKKNMN